MLKDLIVEEQNNISLEHHTENMMLSKEINMESLIPYLKNFSNSTKNVIRDILPVLKERNYKEAVKFSKENKAKLREMDNVQLSNTIIIVPERFDGNIVSYIEDLIIGYDTMSEGISELINSLNVDIGICINNSNDGEIHQPNSIELSKKMKLKRESLTKKLTSYFPVNKSTSHSSLIDVFRSSEQAIKSYDDLNTLEKTLNKLTINKIVKMSEESVELVNVYIDIVNKSSHPNSKQTKELIEVIYETARCLEFCGYLHANVNQVYNTYSTFRL